MVNRYNSNLNEFKKTYERKYRRLNEFQRRLNEFKKPY